MTDTSIPESAEKEKLKKKFDLRDKKYPSKMKKKDKRYVPKNVLDQYPKDGFSFEKDGRILVTDPNSNISLSEGPEFKAKGGRAGYKSGGRGCKLAMKGKGRAYGKNS